MGELIYMYIESIGRGLEKQRIQFSSNYDVDYDEQTRNLMVTENKTNHLSQIYGKSIKDINLIIGKNGAGKSTILDLIGCPSEVYKNFPKNNKYGWFLLYALGEEKYYIEGYSIGNLIKNESFNLGEGFASYCFGSKGGVISFISEDLGMEVLYDKGNSRAFQQHQRVKIWAKAMHVMPKKMKIPGKTLQTMPKKMIMNWSLPHYYEFIVDKAKEIESSFTAENMKLNIRMKPNAMEGGKLIITMPSSFTEEDMKPNKGMSPSYENRNARNLKKYFMEVLVYNSCELLQILPCDWMNSRISKAYGKEFVLVNNKLSLLYIKKLEEKYPNRKFPKKIDTSFWDEAPNNDAESDSNLRKEKVSLEKARKNYPLLFEEIKKYFGKIMQLYELFNGLSQKYFIDKNNIEIPISEKEYFVEVKGILDSLTYLFPEGIYEKTLTELDEDLDYMLQEFSCNITNLSTGEEQFLMQFSKYYEHVNTVKAGTKIILIDEPDASFHPEWSRCYIENMVKMLDRLNEKEDLRFQLIITTHSPFMISDVPHKNIICIDVQKDEETDRICRICQPAEYGLLSNIHDIMKSNFFLKSPFGEFAARYYKETVEMIQNLKAGDEDNLKEINDRISDIGEEILKKRLAYMLNDRLKTLGKELETGEETDLQIELLQKEIKRLKERKK